MNTLYVMAKTVHTILYCPPVSLAFGDKDHFLCLNDACVQSKKKATVR